MEGLKSGDGKSEKSKTGMGFSIAVLGTQVVVLIFLFFVRMDVKESEEAPNPELLYKIVVDVALMMFIGFGYLMTFLKAYGLGAVGYTMLITCLGVEWEMMIEVLMRGNGFNYSLVNVLHGNFGVAAVLISFGALIGKISPLQCVVLTLVELVFYCGNLVFFLTKLIGIADCGGTIIIHVFGAYFGLAAAMTLGGAKNEKLNGASYNSDLFSFVGTLFLWLFWPSFVSGDLPTGSEEHGIAIMNTILALLASTVVTFGLMPLLMGQRLGTVPAQNATLAGGVSIGATANVAMGPFGAVLIGSLAGLLSCAGFCKPLIQSKFDTCGINNLHGMPGILGGLASAVVPLILGTDVKPLMQILGLLGTLVIAGVSGAITGLLLKALGSPEEPFNDETFWDCEMDPKLLVPPEAE